MDCARSLNRKRQVEVYVTRLAHRPADSFPPCTRLHHRSANHHPSANEAIAIRYNCYLRSIQGRSHIHQLIEARESL